MARRTRQWPVRSTRGEWQLAVRLKDIARDLGISPMAVSKALRGHKDIGPETTRQVLQRAAELNYRTDTVARSLVTGRTFLVGLVVPDLKQSFFAEIATAVEQIVGAAGYHVVISHTGETAEQEAASIELLKSRKVDGLIIASAQSDGRSFESLETPFVLLDRKLAGVRANFVGTDNKRVGLIATEHLLEQGCQRIAYLSGPRLSTSEDRLKGYRRALAKHRRKAAAELVVEAGYDDVSGFKAMRQLLALKAPPDGVFCFNDPVAIGAMRACLEAGLRVPHDVAVVGVANMHYSDWLAVPLTTIDQRTSAIGTQAAQQLLDCMTAKKRPAPRDYLMTPELIVRASSLRQAK
jgi:LacI family transcriptional regulator